MLVEAGVGPGEAVASAVAQLVLQAVLQRTLTQTWTLTCKAEPDAGTPEVQKHLVAS